MKPWTLIPLLAALSISACKKEIQYDECGNEICENCGGIGLTAMDASGVVLIIADNVHELDEPITVWNVDNAQQSRVITHTTARGTESGECHGGSFWPTNYEHWRLPPGTTLNWRARNSSGTFDRSGTLRNPDCRDEHDCYMALLEENP